MKPETGATACYVAGMWAGVVLGAIAGAIMALDGATWHRVWQLAIVGGYLGMAAVAGIMAITTEGQDDDDARRSDERASEDGRRAA